MEETVAHTQEQNSGRGETEKSTINSGKKSKTEQKKKKTEKQSVYWTRAKESWANNQINVQVLMVSEREVWYK